MVVLSVNNWCISLGGGVALLYAARELDKIHTSNSDEKTGVQVLQNALKVCPIFVACLFSWLVDNDFVIYH